jgi:thiosulfate/3-mercaptopyruvate sulfurtransferase
MSIAKRFFFLSLVCLANAIGCGTNKFEAEVATEEAAVKLANETLKGGYQLVSTKELKKMMDSEEDFLLIDAMPAEDSFAKGHIRHAVNFAFPKEVMDEWSDEVMDGREKEDFRQLLGEELDRKIVVYCGFVKCARSHNAAICARELGFTNVYRYPGGIHAWRGSGYALTTD